jgi:hypothetical protein
VPISLDESKASVNTVAGATKFDRAQIERHCAILHTAASNAGIEGGKLALCVYGEDPATKAKTHSVVRHFAIGDVAGMVNAAMAFENEPHANVYTLFAVLKPETPDGTRKAADIAKVLALVVDGDADKGQAAPVPPMAASYVLQSSEGNLQHVYWLDTPLEPDDARQLGNAIGRATGADCAGDIAHVWRVPGCLNWPNAVKIRRGRKPESQPVSILQDCKAWTPNADLQTALTTHMQPRKAKSQPTAPRGDRHVDPAKARAFHERLRDAGHYDAGPDARKRYTRAAKALSYDLGDEGRKIWEDVVCWKGTRDDGGEPVDATEADERWADCSSLREGARPITHGTLIEDARTLYGWSGSDLHIERQRTGVEMFAGNTALAIPPEAKPLPAVSAEIIPLPLPAPKDKPEPPRFVFQTESDLESEPDLTWLAEKWIPETSVGIIYGWYGSGKSFIAFDLLLHLAYGLKEWHGVKLPGVPCDGLLIAREGASAFKRRIKSFKKHHKITERNDRLVILRSPVNFGDVAQFEELKAAIEATEKQFRAVVVDTVGRALPGEDMFDPKSITRFMEHLQQLGELGAGVAIGIHHENKSGDVMGSAYFQLNSDFMFQVERDGDPAKDPLRTGKISCVKQKDGEDGWNRALTFKFVATEPNGEGSLVVDSITEAVNEDGAKGGKLSPVQQSMLNDLEEAVRAHGNTAGKVHMDKWREVAYERGSLVEDSEKRAKQFDNAKTGLKNKGLIKIKSKMVEIVSRGVRAMMAAAAVAPDGALPPIPER